jgi:hypothetical protein
VTALGMFYDSTGNKWLRASTYGRGMWQFPLIVTPDFFLSVSNTPMNRYASSLPAQFNGLATSINGYSRQITLACAMGATKPPAHCSVDPATLVPSTGGTPFTVTASDQPGDYMFNASGTDSHSVTRYSPITLNIVDFTLTKPSPGGITVEPGTSSGPVHFQVTAQGSFDGTVNLSCAGLPTGATCNFQPASATPTAKSPVAVILTVDTTSSAAAGTYPITIQGSVSDGPTKTQDLSLTITLDYSLAISNPLLTSYVNAPVHFDGTLTTLNGYNSPVNLSCGAGAPSTCSAAPTPLTPTQSGAAFTVTVDSSLCGTFNFNIVAKGTDPLAVSHAFPVTFRATSFAPQDYTLSISNSPQTAKINVPATFNGTLTGTSCYIFPVNLSCGSGAPPACRPSPADVTPTVNGAPFTVAVSSDVAQAYDFVIAGVGTDPQAIRHTSPVTFTSTNGSHSSFSFTIEPSSSLQSLPAGKPAVYDLALVTSGGKFPSSVVLAYSNNCPSLSTCSLSLTQVSKGSGDTALTFTIATTAPVLADAARALPPNYALWLSAPGLIVTLGGLGRRRKQRGRFLLLWLIVFMVSMLWLNACGSGLQGSGTGNGQAGTPTGTYIMTVSATMSGLPQQTAQVQLTVN